MKNLSDPAVIRSVMEKHGAAFNKGLGQNFLIDPGVCPRMADEAFLGENVCAVEIGPGIGVLTKELSFRAEKVLSFEIDRRLLPVLAETLEGLLNVEVLNQDILKADLPRLFSEKAPGMALSVCANLPYYITSPVIMLFLEQLPQVGAVTVMVQKEAAERLCAPVGSRKAGAITASAAYYAESELLFDVPRDAFFPEPKVNSAVIRFVRRKVPPVKVRDEEAFFRTIRASFLQRRKTAENSLSAGLSLPKEQVASVLTQLGFSKTARAENFTLADFAAISDALFSNNAH